LALNLTKRQKEILDFITHYRASHGISPTQREIRENFGLSSFGTVQKHLRLLQEKKALTRDWNKSRSLAPVEAAPANSAVVLLGQVAAGHPIEPFPDRDTIEVPPSLLGKGEHFVLQVRGDSMVDDGIRDGDFIVVARKEKADNGQTVVALVKGEATLKRFYSDGKRIRLQPANPSMKPIYADPRDVRIQGIVTGLIRNYGRG
jgi:repressor LexA